MTALATYGTSGTSPGLARILYHFDGPHRMTSVRVENPDEFESLPPRFVLRRRAGAWWLHDNSAPRVIRNGGQR